MPADQSAAADRGASGRHQRLRRGGEGADLSLRDYLQRAVELTNDVRVVWRADPVGARKAGCRDARGAARQPGARHPDAHAGREDPAGHRGAGSDHGVAKPAGGGPDPLQLLLDRRVPERLGGTALALQARRPDRQWRRGDPGYDVRDGALLPTFNSGAAGFGGIAECDGYARRRERRRLSDVVVPASCAALAGILSEMRQHGCDHGRLSATSGRVDAAGQSGQGRAHADRQPDHRRQRSACIANSELSIQNAQISNAQAVSDFLTNKYTNAQLYNWMVTQLTTVYTQAYQLAFSLALQAQTAYQYELGRPTDQFIQFAYWDSQYKGLTAGDSLLFDLRRMEAQYLAEQRARARADQAHFAGADAAAGAGAAPRRPGAARSRLDETLFDRDHPGHYFRRLAVGRADDSLRRRALHRCERDAGAGLGGGADRAALDRIPALDLGRHQQRPRSWHHAR